MQLAFCKGHVFQVPVNCFPGEYQPRSVTGASRCSMEQRPRRRWISIVCFSRPVALKFGDEDLQFFFRQFQQIALGQIGAAALGSLPSPKFGDISDGAIIVHQVEHATNRLCGLIAIDPGKGERPSSR
jgi:hypothetical protein